MVILRSQNKITDFLMILAWASPFNREPTAQRCQMLIIAETMKYYWYARRTFIDGYILEVKVDNLPPRSWF